MPEASLTNQLSSNTIFLMKFFFAILLIILFCTPALARPFEYNFYLGPEYWLASSSKANVSSQVLVAGFVFGGNISDLIDAELKFGAGEISNTSLSFNEISLLYTPVRSPNHFIGYGISYLNCNDVIVKATSFGANEQSWTAKIKWGYSFSPLQTFYLSLAGTRLWSYELGWLAYFGKELGDFNLILGYRGMQINSESAVGGIFIASSVYF